MLHSTCNLALHLDYKLWRILSYPATYCPVDFVSPFLMVLYLTCVQTKSLLCLYPREKRSIGHACVLYLLVNQSNISLPSIFYFLETRWPHASSRFWISTRHLSPFDFSFLRKSFFPVPLLANASPSFNTFPPATPPTRFMMFP